VEAEPRSISTHPRRHRKHPGDRELLYRAVENLLRNAVRFFLSAAGGSRVERTQEQALIRIRDHGPECPRNCWPDLRTFFCVATRATVTPAATGSVLRSPRAWRAARRSVCAKNADAAGSCRDRAAAPLAQRLRQIRAQILDARRRSTAGRACR